MQNLLVIISQNKEAIDACKMFTIQFLCEFVMAAIETG